MYCTPPSCCIHQQKSDGGWRYHSFALCGSALPQFHKCVGKLRWPSGNVKALSLETVFGLSVLGYCRNMAEQHGGPREEDPLPV